MIWIRNEHPGSYFRKFKKQFFGLKYLNYLMWIRDGNSSYPGSGVIRDGKSSDPRSGINIPDPQHWQKPKNSERWFCVPLKRCTYRTLDKFKGYLNPGLWQGGGRREGGAPRLRPRGQGEGLLAPAAEKPGQTRGEREGGGGEGGGGFIEAGGLLLRGAGGARQKAEVKLILLLGTLYVTQLRNTSPN